MRRRHSWLLIVVGLSCLLMAPRLAGAQEVNPEEQCREGVALYDRGNHQEALPLLEAGYLGRERGAFVFPDVLGFCALDYGLLTQQVNGEEALEAYAVATDAFRSAELPHMEAMALRHIGDIYLSNNQYEETILYYEQALELTNVVDGEEEEAVAELRATVLFRLGVAMRLLGQYEDARGYYEQALETYRALDDKVWEGELLNHLGIVYRSLGQYDDALDYYEQSLRIRREIGDRRGEGSTLSNMGAVYYLRGQYEAALDTYDQALRIRRSVEDRAGEGTTLGNMGEAYRAQGQYEEALTLLEQALEIHRETGNRIQEGHTLNNIGLLYSDTRQYDDAGAVLEQALAIRREVGDEAGEAITLNNMGLVRHQMDQIEAARETFLQALEIQQRLGSRADQATTLSNIGETYRAQERYEEALYYFAQTLEIDQDRQVGNRAGEGITLINMGLVYEALEQPEEAIVHYERAMVALEEVRSVAGDERGRAAFASTYANLYPAAISLYLEQGNGEAAFVTSERGRARVLLDVVASGYVQLTDESAQALLEAEQAAYQHRAAAAEALAVTEADSPADAGLIANLEAELEEAEAAYEATLDAIEARQDQLAALAPGRNEVLSLEEVQQRLDPRTTLISYYILGHEETAVFIVSADNFEAVTLDVGRAQVSDTLQSYYDFSVSDLATEHARELQHLYAWLVSPVLPHVATAALTIVPHDVLHALPFASLSNGERFLIDDYTLQFLPSASVLPYLQDGVNPGVSSTALVLGNPATPPEEALQDLPGAAHEAGLVAQTLGADPLLGEAATEAAVWEQAGSASVLHLAAHGKYDLHNPLDSALYLAAAGEHDGKLQVSEIFGLDLRQHTDLVVLSACQTQVGEVLAGDEVMALNRAFLFAGTPTVIASLWNVNDEATAALMTTFYDNLRQGVGKAEALRQAQLSLRESYPHPFYWAAFVLTGEGGELPEESEVPVVDGETPAAQEAQPAAEDDEPAVDAPATGNREGLSLQWPVLVGSSAGLIVLLLFVGYVLRRARR